MATTDRDRGDHETPSPMLTVAAVARRLGVAPSTLRTWDRRYDLGPSAHTAGSHRRYGPQDLARLVVMRRLTLEGVPPAEAARIALAAPLDAPPDAPGHLVPGYDANTHTRPGEVVALHDRSRRHQEGATPEEQDGEDDADVPSGESPSAAAAAPGSPPPEAAVPHLPEWRPPAVPAARGRRTELDPGLWHQESARHERVVPAWPFGAAGVRAPVRSGGGRVVALPDGSPAARGLARAAMSLDSGEVQRLFGDAVTAFGVRAAWETMAMPVLQSIGERWRVTGDGVDVEHAFSEALTGVLRTVTASLRRPRNVRPVVLACAEGDYHTLPLHALAAALAEEGVGVRLLGVGMPPAALVAAVRRTGPATVFLYARLRVRDVQVLHMLPRQRPAPRLVVGGPGWHRLELPPQVTAADGLGDAIDRVLESIDL
jgi:DNA-binding transcriptional MerR regulator